MDEIVSMLQERKELLLQLKLQIEEELKKAPEGGLRITHCNGHARFYLTGQNGKRSYLKRTQSDLINSLAQKMYLETLLKQVLKQSETIHKFLTSYSPNGLSNFYQEMVPDRKKRINPLVLPDDDFALMWQKEPYSGKPYAVGDVEIYTENAERVRSKSEKIIADKLRLLEIPYKYECPLILAHFGMVYPDFTVLNKRTRKVLYWEHLGMMDDVDYCERALRKIEAYVKAGILPGRDLIITHETSKRPVDIKVIEQFIEQLLK